MNVGVYTVRLCYVSDSFLKGMQCNVCVCMRLFSRTCVCN
jgi:hypothetical protein